MKFIVCVIAAFAALQHVSCYTPSTNSEELVTQLQMKMLRDSMRERVALEEIRSKINAVCPGYGNRLENVTSEIAACADLIDETDETMCSIVRNHVKRCLKPLTNMFEECLPSRAKKVPEMIVNMLVASSSHLCKTDGEHIFELGNACIKNINPKTQRCVRRIATRFQMYQRNGNVPSAADFCDVIESFRPCLQSHLNSACGHPVTRESYLSLFDDGTKVCKSYEQNEIEVIEVDSS